MANESQQALLARLRDVVTRRAGHIAVREQARTYTYAALGATIDELRRRLAEASHDGAPIGLLLDRSGLAYAAMWASLALGRAYVPLNTSYPHSRLRTIVEQAGIGVIVCDEDTLEIAAALGVDADRIVTATPMAVPFDTGVRELACWQATGGGDIAYVLFTSGSTGQPKGVPISYDNLRAFIDNMRTAIPYDEDDVCSQVCELSFDFSVEEIYLALLCGCTLCPARRVDLFNPAHYIQRNSISVWISVPSLARVILSNGVVLGDALASIRISIFNGEALTTSLAEAWQSAAPNSEIWNSYGPTECTVAVAAERWTGDPAQQESDVIAIGRPFPDCRTALLEDEEIVATSAASDGRTGELLLASPQRFSGYLDPQLASPFVADARGTVYYRTGDRVRWHAGRLYYLGRIDHQVKIGGHRIELLEVEHRLRAALGIESLAVAAHPPQRPTELVLFIEGAASAPALPDLETLGLPAYMRPKRTILVARLPTSAHGKLDRAALAGLASGAS